MQLTRKKYNERDLSGNSTIVKRKKGKRAILEIHVANDRYVNFLLRYPLRDKMI